MELSEERRNKKKATTFIVLSLLILVFLATLGVPIISKVIDFATSFKKTSSQISDNTPPAPPLFETISDFLNTSPLQITGSVEPGNTVIINLNEISDEIQADEEGKFATSIKLIDGENTLYALAKDPEGNLSRESKKYIIIYDNEDPEIIIISPSDNSTFYGSKQRNVSIEGNTEAGSSVTVNDRIALVDEDGNFSLNYSLTQGDNSILIKSIDKAGNETEKSLKLIFNE